MSFPRTEENNGFGPILQTRVQLNTYPLISSPWSAHSRPPPPVLITKRRIQMPHLIVTDKRDPSTLLTSSLPASSFSSSTPSNTAKEFSVFTRRVALRTFLFFAPEDITRHFSWPSSHTLIAW
ncbi:hypothetical protein E2C01_042996 [Portunus trituberculatus]|uniref:Uncharacterized protein n=1 Tax=Portunus trituberculatus TaxID=210409 RepID=A0A5B7FNB4_PORTR|nr:hypothetical protein [Portunus trituberculatus]